MTLTVAEVAAFVPVDAAIGRAPDADDATLRDAVRSELNAALARALERGLRAPPETPALPAVEVERPAKPEHGDLATSIALKLARPLRRRPIDIADAILAEIRTTDADTGSPIEGAEVAPPGFINVRVSTAALESRIRRVLADPLSWGRVPAPRDAARINVEFVSANPTGPLHIGNARGAFVGDLLARVLDAAGNRTTREYYFNDFGAQVRNLGLSVLAVRTGGPVPDDGYHGDYVSDLAASLPDSIAAAAGATGEDPGLAVGVWASERVRAGIEASLERLGVHFDVWKSEGSLHREGWVEQAIERLRDGGHVYEQDGATWFRSTTFGDDKDRVLIRSTGEPTYFAADVGYVVEKFSRGFDELIYVWGADHHGTVARLRGAAQAMGLDRERVQMLLTGWVRFVRDGVEVSMSKRAGTFITLDELLSEVGVDAARWFFASRGANVDIDFDIELAKKQSNENPVFYVQYAHARIASILRKATTEGLAPSASIDGLLAGEPEAALARVIVRFPEVVEDAAAARETHAVTTYATELATAFHQFYRDARVVDPSEPARSARRLALARAAQVTLASALGLLGISAPESM
ncbi:MAG TPA: arginine--tRNA ligase [Candidatus Limnocylindrales bacterium]|nr:arginine--tRNA ligase [Candidatus Limnocylindrales bacterium]